jgi:N-sulfoglucosamine sulfohydrolase
MKPSLVYPVILIPSLCFLACTRDENNRTSGDRPNILIAMGDDISYPHMSAYGTTWLKTPGFDKVAQNGILFNNAYTPNAKSSPSRACFLTGRNSWQLEEACNHNSFFPQKFKTFIESLTEKGYTTGYTAKGWAPGIAVDSSGKPRELTGKAFNSKTLLPPSKYISTIDYAGNFEDFLNSRSTKEPFCFWYGAYEPHRPYEQGSGISKGGMKITDINKTWGFWPDNDLVKTDMLDYAFEIEHFDNQLVKMLDILEKRGELENTIVIVTADNGMPFPRIKGQAYEYSNHVPLAIMWKKGIRNPGRKVFDLLSFIDIAPTLLEIAGIKLPQSGMQPIEGRSFTKILFSRKQGFVSKENDHLLIGKERHDVGRPDDEGYPIRGIIKNGFLYLKNYSPERWPAGNPETGYLNTDGSPTKSLILAMRRTGISTAYWKLCFGKISDEELYDLGKDPECLKNLVSDAGYNTLKRNLSAQLYDELLNQDDPRVYGDGAIFDKYPYADRSTRDFYNRFIKGKISRKKAGWVDSTDFETEGF